MKILNLNHWLDDIYIEDKDSLLKMVLEYKLQKTEKVTLVRVIFLTFETPSNPQSPPTNRAMPSNTRCRC